MALPLALAVGSAAAGTFPYQVLRRVPVPGSAPVRALAGAPGGASVYVASGDVVRRYGVSGQLLASTRLLGPVTGLAATADQGGGLFVTVRKPGRLVILRGHPLHVAASVRLPGGAPSAVLYDSIGHALYVESRAGRTLTRVDPATGKSLGTVRLSTVPGQIAADGRGTLYVADAARGALEVIDTRTMRRSGSIPLEGCRSPTGLAMDTIGRRLFVACGNGRALIVDADLGFTFEQLPIQRAGSLRAVFAFHPLGAGGWKGGVFIAGNGPQVDAIRMNAFVRYVGGGQLALSGPCAALAVSPASGRLWLAIAPRGARGAGELWVLGKADSGVSR